MREVNFARTSYQRYVRDYFCRDANKRGAEILRDFYPGKIDCETKI